MREGKVKRFLAIISIMIFGVLGIYNVSFIARSNVLNRYDNIRTETLNNNIFTDNAKYNTNLKNNDSIGKIDDIDQLKLKLIDDVDKHIRKSFNIYDRNIPKHLVECALRYDIDICFIMAQTKIETGFGTVGAGRPTSRYSLFGVCKRYNNYYSAIDDYCRLLRRSYLGDKRTEQDLMRNYVTLGGARYASDKRYEITLSSEYKKIRNNTDIYDTWMRIRKS